MGSEMCIRDRFKYVPEDQIGEAFGRISTDLVNQMKETIGEERL